MNSFFHILARIVLMPFAVFSAEAKLNVLFFFTSDDLHPKLAVQWNLGWKGTVVK